MKINSAIIFYAFRYALGRKTYVVSEVVDYLIENWKELSNTTQFLIQTEIRIAIERKEAGMNMDVKQWKKLLKLPKGNVR